MCKISGAQLSGGPTERGPKCPFFKGGHLGPEEGHKDNCCISVFLYFESTPQMFSMNIKTERKMLGFTHIPEIGFSPTPFTLKPRQNGAKTTAVFLYFCILNPRPTKTATVFLYLFAIQPQPLQYNTTYPLNPGSAFELIYVQCTWYILLSFVSSVRSSSGYHGLMEIQRSHFFRFFKFFSF